MCAPFPIWDWRDAAAVAAVTAVSAAIPSRRHRRGCAASRPPPLCQGVRRGRDGSAGPLHRAAIVVSRSSTELGDWWSACTGSVWDHGVSAVDAGAVWRGEER